MLLLISWLITLLVLLCVPFLSKQGRTISKKNFIIVLLISAILGIGVETFFAGWNWVSIVLIVFPTVVLLFGDFKIIYNVSERDVLEKIKTMLKRLFCNYTNNNRIINIDKVGTIRIYSLFVVSLLIIKSSNSPKAKIIFDNIFKIFYDNEY